MRILLALLTVVTMLFAGCAKIVVVNVSKQNVNADGVFYALPKTGIRFGLVVEKVEKTAARYTRFAGIFAPDAEAVCKLNENNECVDPKTYKVKNI